MKTLFLTLLLFIEVNSTAQQLSGFYDATSHNAGFSYNVTISYHRVKSWSSARPSEVYKIKLISVSPDSRGFYYGNQRNKFYNYSEIGSSCNPNNWNRVYVTLSGQCKNAINKNLSFSRIGDEVTEEYLATENASCNFNDITVSVPQEAHAIMKIIDDKERAVENRNTQNSNSTNNNPATQNKTTTKPLDNYDANTGLYTNPMANTSSGSSSVDSFNKGYQQGQQIVDVATGILDLFAPTPAQLQRRAAEAAEYERQKKREEAIEEKAKEDRFKSTYLPLRDKAVKGDDNARMTLYYASYKLWCTEYVPEREDWLYKAYNNNNFDAILELSEKSKDRISILEGAAKMGCADAMVMLGEWYDTRNKTVWGTTFVGGEHSKTALYWFEKAAEKNNPKALYYLGMIYKYGITQNTSNGYGFLKRIHVEYDIKKDEKKAFEYFSKALDKQHIVSIYSRGSSYYGAKFDSNTFQELAIMYKKGKFIAKDKEKAKELENNYKNYEFVRF